MDYKIILESIIILGDDDVRGIEIGKPWSAEAGLFDVVETSSYGMVLVWHGMVWYGMVWYGMTWYGVVWCGMVWYGMEWHVRCGMVW